MGWRSVALEEAKTSGVRSGAKTQPTTKALDVPGLPNNCPSPVTRDLP